MIDEHFRVIWCVDCGVRRFGDSHDSMLQRWGFEQPNRRKLLIYW
jgi:hypothetical protein